MLTVPQRYRQTDGRLTIAIPRYSTTVLSRPISEILQVFSVENIDPTLTPPEFWGCFLGPDYWCWGSENEDPKLINRVAQNASQKSDPICAKMSTEQRIFEIALQGRPHNMSTIGTIDLPVITNIIKR